MGAIFSGMVKQGLQTPDGKTSYYDADKIAQPLAQAAAATAQPGRSDILSPSVAGDGTESGTPVNFDAPVMPQPRVTHPTFQQANTDGGFMSPELTTKGKILSGLITAAQGAAAGMAASTPINGGRTGVGVGPALAAGFQLPYQQAAQRNELRRQQLEQQMEEAKIAALPGTLQQERDLRASEIAKNNAAADRKDVFQAKDGSILERQSDGSLKTLYAAPTKPDLGDTVDGRQQIIDQMKTASFGTPEYDAEGNLKGRTVGAPYTLTPAQEQQYLLTGKIPESKTSNPNQSELLLRAAQGDQTALKALQLQSDFEVRTHQGFAGANTDGLTAAQQRQLKTDATWTNLNRRMSALTQQYTRTAQFDPDGAAALGKQIDDLATQAETRKQQILQGGKLSLRGKGIPPNSIPMAVSHQQAKPLDPATAAQFLQQAGGDKNKARQLASAAGYSF